MPFYSYTATFSLCIEAPDKDTSEEFLDKVYPTDGFLQCSVPLLNTYRTKKGEEVFIKFCLGKFSIQPQKE